MAINFLTDSQYIGSLSISEDGANATVLSESASGDFTIDAVDDIRLDAGGGDIAFRDDDVEFGRITNNSGSGIILKSSATNTGIYIQPNGTGNVYCETDTLIVTAAEAEPAKFLLRADQGDDDGDDWYMINHTDNVLQFTNTISGSQITHFSITPNASVTASTAAFAGKLTVATIDEVGSDTNKFLMSDSGEVKFVTGANLLSYIGAGTGSGNTTSSGTANKVAKFDGTNSIVDSIITDDGSDISVAGDVLIPAGYVGRDSQNRVDFSTDNQIIFRVADTHRAKMDSDGFLPYADSAYDLGTSSLYWKDAYIDTITTTGNISVGGGLLFDSDDGATCTNVNWLSFLCPDAGTSVNSKIGYLETNFPDNSKVTFGNGTNGDMQIWHKSTGSINRIDSGAIPIKIQSYGDVTIGDDEIYNNYSGLFKIDQTLSRAGVYGSEEAMWTFYADSSNIFTALFDGNIKLVTSSTGINITGGFTSSASSSCAGLNMTADIAMAGNNITLDTDGNIELDPSLSAGQSSGTILKFGSGLLTAGDVYYAYSSMGSTQWSTVNHTSANTTKLLAVAIGTSATTNGMLLNGILYKSMHGFTVGLPLYLASSNGDFTTTVPTTSNYYARVLGYAIDSNHIYFCPDNTWVEID